ncbi:zinc finger protein ZAT11 [Humulus lupulus]|uniref:zinc finger protein ZAT11 n=1 Tax=Humulus lupulus TaxID=3486 RepID=UPI002B413157|nr:zinc finger protein ZAT11 [Humulus lupulus]
MLMMMKKRMREEADDETSRLNTSIANCLMLLQSHNQIMTMNHNNNPSSVAVAATSSGHDFECKTCNKRFSSFQALGGHRASHKKPKLANDGDHHDHHGHEDEYNKKVVNKKHVCTICGVVFSMGQALGGHMRRHRAAMDNGVGFSSLLTAAAEEGGPVVVAPRNLPLVALKRSDSIRIKADSWLDLNLTPLENDLKILFGKMAPAPAVNSSFIF